MSYRYSTSSGSSSEDLAELRALRAPAKAGVEKEFGCCSKLAIPEGSNQPSDLIRRDPLGVFISYYTESPIYVFYSSLEEEPIEPLPHDLFVNKPSHFVMIQSHLTSNTSFPVTEA